MKLFLKNLLVYIGAVILVGVFLGLYYREVYFHRLSPQKTTKLLLLGDSHVECALNPALLNDAESFALSAEPIWITFEKLRSLLSVSTNIDTVVVSLTAHRSYVNGLKKTYFDQRAQFWASYPSPSCRRRTENFSDSITVFTEGVSSAVMGGWNVLTRNATYRNSLAGGFLPGDYSVFRYRDVMDVARERNRFHFSVGENRFEDGLSHYLATLDAIVDLGKKHSVRVIFVSTPLQKEYRELFPKDVYQDYLSVCAFLRTKGKGVSVVDLSAYSPPDLFCFRDADHLNERGAHFFTAVFSKYLDSLPKCY